MNSMAAPILTTKFYFPSTHSGIVPRPRLVDRLNQGLSRPLTIVSAPAGYGKTTLLSEWHSTSGKDFPVAWLSLDEGDNEARDFLNYLVIALESAGTGLAGKTLLLLQSTIRPPAETLLTSLVEDLAGYPHDLAIILEDYHILESATVHAAIKFLLEHLPPKVHLVLLTRCDPPLPLARLRARGQMTEIRTVDLRFSIEETTMFLNEVMGLGLSAGDVAALEARTEGWVAGLQLAALSMKGRSDISGFINTFTGSHRYIVDYLVEEVLNRQPSHVRDFLLKTSILERMSASLCDTLLQVDQSGDSQSILEYLERANIFLIPLDDERRWYRYHHLFADVLRNRLQHSQAAALPGLYRRAIAWYEQNDLIDQAIQHALALKDYEYAAQMLHRHWLHLLLQGHTRGRLISWCNSLPEEYLLADLRLSMVLAWMLISNGMIAEGKKYADQIEKTLKQARVDPELASLPAEILAFRAHQAVEANQTTRALELAQQAEAAVPENAIFARGVIALTLAIVYLEKGCFAEAYQVGQQALELTRAGGTPAGRVGATKNTVYACKYQGQLHLAMDICKEAMQTAEAENQARFIPFSMVYLAMASIFYEWNNLDQAERYLGIASQMVEQNGDPQEIVAVRLMIIQLRCARGNLSGGFNMLESLDPLFQKYPETFIYSQLASGRARWQATLGHLDQAQDWLATTDLTIHEQIGLNQGISLFNAVRIMLACNQITEALTLLRKIEPAASSSLYWRIEGQVLQAIAWYKQGDKSCALGRLENALNLAEKGGFVRLFLDESPLMVDLLRQAASNGINLRYTTRLLDSVSIKVIRQEAAPAPGGLLEPLSDREREVLQLIARGRLNKEIADELVIAIGTVKRHTANIFRKLDVVNRTQAVAKSRELGLL